MNNNLFQNACAIVVNRVLIKNQVFFNNIINAKLISYSMRGKYYTFTLEIENKIYTAKYTFDSNVFLQGILEITTDTYTETYSVERINNSLRIYTDAFNYDELLFADRTKLIDISNVMGRKESVSCVTLDFKNQIDLTITYVMAYATDCKCMSNATIRTLFLISGAVEYSITRCEDVVSYHSSPIDLIIYNGALTQVLCIDQHIRGGRNFSGTIKLLNSEFKQHFDYTNSPKEEFTDILEYETDQMNKNSKSIKRSYAFAIQKDKIVIPKVGKFSISVIGNDVIFRKI